MRILLNMDLDEERHNDTINIHYLDPGRTNFSLVTSLSMPAPEEISDDEPELAFSADGSKFAIATTYSGNGVSVWDIRSKVPLQTFMERPLDKNVHELRLFLQFSSGNLGKEILTFVEVRLIFTF